MTKKQIILWIICLVAADQGSKLIVANYFIDTNFDIIDSILGFHPIFNDRYSYFNAILNLNLGLLPHIVILILLEGFILFGYDYLKTIHLSSKLSDYGFIFGQAAVICVFCGFFLWKDGILDFMYVYPFTFDLKDIYLNCTVLFFLYDFYKKKAAIDKVNLKIGDYIKLKVKKDDNFSF